MMDIFVWFLQENESALAAVAPSQSSFLLLAYVLLSISIKRASLTAAFFMSCMLFEASIFDPLSEASLYLLTFAIYSYVITCNALTFKQRFACGILLFLSLSLAYDAYFYGVNGVYGASETVIYNYVEYLALYAHIIFISTFVNYRRIRDSIRCFSGFVLRTSRNSAYMLWV